MKEVHSQYIYLSTMKGVPSINHIFLIDDDAVINMINKKIISLTFPSLKVSSYIHAGVALDRLKQWAESEPSQLPDFIFLDINMPELDGWEFLDEFMKLPAAVQEKVQVIMLTSSIDISDIAKSRTYRPVIDFLSKPLNPDRLNTLMINHRKM